MLGQVKPFKDAWAEADKIPGWLTRAEAKQLYDAAMHTPPDGVIIEVGSYRGRSLTILAATGRRVIAIDPVAQGTDAGDGKSPLTEECAASLAAVRDKYANVEWQRKHSREAVVPGKIHMLYIDGDHRAPQPQKDFRYFESSLVPNAIVFFHDFREEGPNMAVCMLESAGALRRIGVVDRLYFGQAPKEDKGDRLRVFLAHPSYGRAEKESHIATKHASTNPAAVQVTCVTGGKSLLAHNFNSMLCQCLDNEFDVFAMLHGDVGASVGWLDVMLDDMAELGLDIIHAAVAIKDGGGITSTALAYSPDRFALCRRLSLKELHELPQTFTIDDVRQSLDSAATHMLPNTGCLVAKAAALKDFPGFNIEDKIERDEDGRYRPLVCPEDWNLGHWAAEQGLRVGCTWKVQTNHYGRHDYSNQDEWGPGCDSFYFTQTAKLEALENAS